MKKSMCFYIFLTVISLSLIISSCASFKTIFRKPVVSFESAKLRKIDFSAAGFDFKYRIDNPNAVSLEMADFSYDLYIDGSKFLSGNSASPVTVQKEGSSFVDIPVDIVYSELYSVFRSIYTKDSASYRIEAEFTFNLPVFGKAVFPVKHEGTFPVLKLPEISFESFRVVRISPLSAVLELSANVLNKNSFAISPDSFSYDFSVNSSQWMKGTIKDVSEMPPGKSTSVKIPVEISPARSGKEIFDIIFKGNPVDIVLSGSLSFRTSYPGMGSSEIPFRFEKNTPAVK